MAVVLEFVRCGRFVLESDVKPGPLGIHPVDLVLLLVAISFAATLILLDRFAIPAFARLYRDFAAVLPWVTRAVVSHIAPLAFAVLAVVVAALGSFARTRGSKSAALWLGLAGIGIGVAGVAFCFYGLYAPMFELAGNVKP